MKQMLKKNWTTVSKREEKKVKTCRKSFEFEIFM